MIIGLPHTGRPKESMGSDVSQNSSQALGQGLSRPLLKVDNLRIEFFSRQGHVQAVRDVSFQIEPGETLGLVGESGSGKSVTSQALLGIVDSPGRIVGGDVQWKGHSILHGKGAAQYAKRIRGKEIAIVFQDPMASLNPLFKVGTQLMEVLRHHMGMSRADARARALELLDLVGIPSPQQRINQYPWEFSGGMQQRVLIAMGLSCEPELLIADEPTTALDVTIQAQILELMADLQDRLGLAILLITHDLGVVAGFCERVAVMYAGKVVEKAPADDIYHDPGHPYTVGLLQAMPRLDDTRPRLDAISGVPPDLRDPPQGCAFHPRCPIAIDRCREEEPPLQEHKPGRDVACWNAFDLRLRPGAAAPEDAMTGDQHG